MSASDKRLTLALALAAVSCAALGGMGQTTLPVPATDPGVAVGPETGKVQLRCWQQGRLLFDTRSLEAMPTIPGSMVALKGDTARGPLQVVNLADAVCLVLPNDGVPADTLRRP